jgi:protein phosphatase
MRLTLPDPCVVVLIGAAGAGKSTFAARRFAPDEVLSSDAYRSWIGRSEADQDVTRAAFAALHRELARRLGDGRLAVVDATNLEPAARRAVLARAGRAGVPAVAIVLAPRSDTVHARNAGRADRRVPTAVVDRPLERLGEIVRAGSGALLAEGFGQVVIVRSEADLDGLVIERVPAARATEGGSGAS